MVFFGAVQIMVKTAYQGPRLSVLLRRGSGGLMVVSCSALRCAGVGSSRKEPQGTAVGVW